MKFRKALSTFLALIFILSSFSLCTLGASAEGTRPVYATTSTTVAQNGYAYCYVYLDDLTDLSALTVAVHYDTSKVTVQSVYNKVGCVAYDSSNKDGRVQLSYIFDGKGSEEKTQLFYFYYKVNGTAEAGNTYFDIVVSDAYNNELDALDIVGSRCSFKITESTATKTCSLSSTASVSTAVREEFTLSYRLSSYQIASGSFEIQYDKDLFEFVELTKGQFLDEKVTDVNSNLDGSVAVSFVGILVLK